MSVRPCRNLGARSGSERATDGRMAGARAKTRDGRRRGRIKFPVSPVNVGCKVLYSTMMSLQYRLSLTTGNTAGVALKTHDSIKISKAQSQTN